MKKITSIVTLLVFTLGVAFTAVSCSPEQRIDAEIKAYKKTLPQYAGDGITITDIEHKGDFLIYTAEYNEQDFSIDMIKDQPEILAVMKNAVGAEMFHSSDPSVRELIKVLRQANMGLRYDIVGKLSGEKIELTFEPDEI